MPNMKYLPVFWIFQKAPLRFKADNRQADWLDKNDMLWSYSLIIQFWNLFLIQFPCFKQVFLYWGVVVK